MDLIRETVAGWWRFFWRYMLLSVLLLLCGGFMVNQFGEFVSPKSLFLLTVCWSASVHAVASLTVFFYILGRGFRSSDRRLEIPGGPAGVLKRLGVWFLFYWRFVLFSVAISLTLGALLPLAAHWIGFDPLDALKYSKYIGNFAVFPASLISFLFLMCRRENRRRLVFIAKAGPPVPASF